MKDDKRIELNVIIQIPNILDDPIEFIGLALDPLEVVDVPLFNLEDRVDAKFLASLPIILAVVAKSDDKPSEYVEVGPKPFSNPDCKVVSTLFPPLSIELNASFKFVGVGVVFSLSLILCVEVGAKPLSNPDCKVVSTLFPPLSIELNASFKFVCVGVLFNPSLIRVAKLEANPSGLLLILFAVTLISDAISRPWVPKLLNVAFTSDGTLIGTVAEGFKSRLLPLVLLF
jgi:hypothetical protein